MESIKAPGMSISTIKNLLHFIFAHFGDGLKIDSFCLHINVQALCVFFFSIGKCGMYV